LVVLTQRTENDLCLRKSWIVEKEFPLEINTGQVEEKTDTVASGFQ
jgi:hypothetical protein